VNSGAKSFFGRLGRRRARSDAWCGLRRRTPPKEKKMAKSQRRGNKEARKPKAAKPSVAAPASPFAPKSASAATSPPKRKG
jgi:hypothetical protein